MAKKLLTAGWPKLEKALPFILVVGGVIGFIASFIITLDKERLLENPSFRPDCDLNPIISCGTVMQSAQGSLFGFPNPWLGLAAFAVLITIGVGMWAGARFARWFWLSLLGGSALGIVFVHWLFFQSVYRIQTLCPYCMVVWVVTITAFWYLLQYTLVHRYLTLPGKYGNAVTEFIRKHHLDLLVLWLLVIAALILNHFWYYFGPK